MPDEVVENSEETNGAPDSEESAEEAAEDVKTPPGEDLKEVVESAFPGAVLEQSAYQDDEDEATFVVGLDAIVAVATHLRDHGDSHFELLTDLTATHYPEAENPFEVLYHLYSIEHNRRLRLKVRIKEGQAMPTVSGVWSSADWMEREVYDLFGIEFEDHPDLRRILLPDNWGSHPMRKDYPLEGRGERIYTKPKRKEIGD